MVAFTLAEVLITLAIIGVVAVLTIPTLVANYQEKGWNTAATVFERKLEESLKVMNTQGTLAGYKTTEEFVNELQKHLKITKVCKNDDLQSCFEDKVMFGIGEAVPEEVDMTTIKTAKDFGLDGWNTNIVGLQLANGTTGLFAYNPECRQDQYSNQAAVKSCIAILYDTSAFSKPNTSGKDLRSINVAKLGNQCMVELDGECLILTEYNRGLEVVCEPGRLVGGTTGPQAYLATKLYHTENFSGDIQLDYDLARSYGINVADGESFSIYAYSYGAYDYYFSSFNSNSFVEADYNAPGSVYVFCSP